MLAGKTFPGEDGLITGTMPQRGNQFKSGLWSNPDGDAYVDTYVNIDGGYYPPGTQVTIQAYDPNLVSNNIRAGAKVLGVPGKSTVVDTADAVLDPQYLLVGQSGYDDGLKSWSDAKPECGKPSYARTCKNGMAWRYVLHKTSTGFL